MSQALLTDPNDTSVIDNSQILGGVNQHGTNDDDACAQMLPAYEQSIDFLKAIHPKRRWVLTAIHPVTKGTITQTFDEGRADVCENWLRKFGVDHNLYFAVNPSSFDVTKKLQREEIDHVFLLHVDIDPRVGVPLTDEQKRIAALLKTPIDNVPLPSVITNSGGGMQAFWILKTPIAINRDLANAESAKGYNLFIQQAYEADSCHDITRLMRLPGTVNWPDANKIKKGRVAALATVEELHPDRAYDIEQFRKMDDAANSNNLSVVIDTANVKRLPTLDVLNISPRLKTIIQNGSIPDEPKQGDNSRSVWLFQAVCELIRARIDDDTIFSIITDSRFKISESVLDKGKGRVDTAKKVISKAHSAVAKETKNTLPQGAILVQGGMIHQHEADAERILIQNNVPIYQRGPALVRPIRLDQNEANKLKATDGIIRKPGSLVLTDVTARGIQRALSPISQWFVPRKTSHGRIDPPLEVASHVLDNKGGWTFHVLKGITATPTLREDGTILQTTGYDLQSRMIFDPGIVAFPNVPECPTISDAQAALQKFAEIFTGFPFVGNARSVFYAMMITAVVRPALRTAPMFAVSAPMAGTGKDKLCECAGILSLGITPPSFNVPPNDEELEKRLGSVIVNGDPIVYLANVSRPLRGDLLCSMLTNPDSVSIRPLGKTKIIVCPCNCTVIASGNNLEFQGDLCRRVLVCKLDANMPRPDTRKFPFDPVTEVRKRRVELVMSVLTIMRAYINAGKPRKSISGDLIALEPFGSFEDFDLIRAALCWLDLPDPCGARESIYKSDDTRQSFVEALEEWYKLIGNKAVTIKDIRDMWLNNTTKYDPLIEALKDATNQSDHQGFNVKATGKRLGKRKDTFAGEFKFEQAELNRSGVSLWRVTRVEHQPGLPFDMKPSSADAEAQTIESCATFAATGLEAFAGI